jgi:hypothetical protein
MKNPLPSMNARIKANIFSQTKRKEADTNVNISDIITFQLNNF